MSASSNSDTDSTGKSGPSIGTGRESSDLEWQKEAASSSSSSTSSTGQGPAQAQEAAQAQGPQQSDGLSQYGASYSVQHDGRIVRSSYSVQND